MDKKTKEYIKECRKVHGNRYDLKKVKYTRAKDKVKVGCPVHGEFEIVAYNFKKGSGCKRCSLVEAHKSKRLGLKKFIERAKKAHGDYYSYEFIEDIHSQKDLVTIVCPVHGKFQQKASDHTIGKGCRKCALKRAGKKRRKTLKEVLQDFKKVHNKRYDYSKVKYKGDKVKVTILCKEHGKFLQTPSNHLKGSGCPECGRKKASKEKVLTQKEFSKKVEELSKGRYTLKGKYKGTKKKVKLKCKYHGSFKVIPNAFISKGQECPKCAPSSSKGEIQVNKFVERYIKTEQNSRDIIPPYELDIVIPEQKLAIEYNGVYFHSDRFLNDKYHLDKLDMCQEKGYRLIQVFEDEWLFKKEIVKSRILSYIGKTPKIVYARKTEIKEVNSREAMKFLEENHLQGKLGSRVRLGLYYKGKLKALMTFGALRKSLGAKSKKGHYELLRFCNERNTTVVGGASKLFKHFLKEYGPKEVISYADKRWSEGELYKTLGFTEIHHSRPNYFYTKDGVTRESRFKYRKSVLVEKGYNKKRLKEK